MKDYYDIWVLSQAFNFEGEILKNAIKATFRRRKTPLPTDVPVGLTKAFSDDPIKQTQWKAFVRRSRLKSSPADLHAVVDGIRAFLIPISFSALHVNPFHKKWQKGRDWR
jgi:hypothetical protein